jgi:hypothetical protein
MSLRDKTYLRFSPNRYGTLSVNTSSYYKTLDLLQLANFLRLDPAYITPATDFHFTIDQWGVEDLTRRYQSLSSEDVKNGLNNARKYIEEADKLQIAADNECWRNNPKSRKW